MYSYTSGTGSQTWDTDSKVMANGTSPTKWNVQLDFTSLLDQFGAAIPCNTIRKMRWNGRSRKRRRRSKLQGIQKPDEEAVHILGPLLLYPVARAGEQRFPFEVRNVRFERIEFGTEKFDHRVLLARDE